MGKGWRKGLGRGKGEGRTGSPLTPTPLLLLAYGAYSQTFDLSFDPNLQVLLDRGWKV